MPAPVGFFRRLADDFDAGAGSATAWPLLGGFRCRVDLGSGRFGAAWPLARRRFWSRARLGPVSVSEPVLPLVLVLLAPVSFLALVSVSAPALFLVLARAWAPVSPLAPVWASALVLPLALAWASAPPRLLVLAWVSARVSLSVLATASAPRPGR